MKRFDPEELEPDYGQNGASWVREKFGHLLGLEPVEEDIEEVKQIESIHQSNEFESSNAETSDADPTVEPEEEEALLPRRR